MLGGASASGGASRGASGENAESQAIAHSHTGGASGGGGAGAGDSDSDEYFEEWSTATFHRDGQQMRDELDALEPRGEASPSQPLSPNLWPASPRKPPPSPCFQNGTASSGT